MEVKKALTIAGSDNSGGAGIQADLKVFSAFRVYGLSAITAITAQNSNGVVESTPVDPKLLKLQVESVLKDTTVDAVKIGMLQSKGNVQVVIDSILAFDLKNVVLDPVLVSSSGKPLLEEKAIDLFKKKLLPLVSVITPNTEEAKALTGISISSEEDMQKACLALIDFGVKAVYLKGGHLENNEDFVIDVGYIDGKFLKLIYPRAPVDKGIHGTGCVLSSAIAANLALGYSLEKSIRIARSFIQKQIEDAFRFGNGYLYMKLL